MNISQVSVKHPSRIAMLLIVLLVFGLISVSNMNIEFMSDISLPTIEVLTYYPGSGAREIEKDITDILEKEFITLPNFSSISSSSTNFVSWITITFRDGVDPYDMLEEVRYRIRNMEEQLPSNLDRAPIAVVGEASMLPVFTFSISSSGNITELSEFIDDTVVPNITRIKGVAEVSVTGRMNKEVRVRLRTKDLYTQKVSAIEVMQAIRNSNTLIPLETTTYLDKETILQFDGRVDSIESLKDIVVGVNASGSLVSLRDVADVSIELQQPDIYIDGTQESAIIVDITKRKDGNTISIAKEIRSFLEGPLFSDSSSYSIEVINDDSATVKASLFTVIRSGLFGIIMAVFVMLFFLADIRATLTIALSIPLSILFTLIGMRILNISINLMSLSGMVIALGMVVDASIVMLEHIIKEYDEYPDKALDKVIIEAAQVISSPILASTTTTIAVFIPLSLLTGIVGSILRDVSLTIILSLSASFLVAVIVIPFILSILLRRKKKILRIVSFFSSFISSLTSWYQKGLSWALNHRVFIFIIACSALAASLVFVGLLGITFIPSTDTGEFYVDITYEEGTNVEKTRERSLKALELVKKEVKESTSITLTSGGSSGFGFKSPNEANMRVILTPVENRTRSIFTIIEKVQHLLNTHIVGAEIRVTNGGFDKLVGFVADGGGYAITLEGEDSDLLYETAQKIEKALSSEKSVLSTSIDTSYDSQTLTLLMSQYLMASLGLSSMESGITSTLLFSEMEVGELKSDQNNTYRIMLDSDIGQNPFDSSTLLKARLITSNKREISFASIANLVKEKTVNRINHTQRINTITVSATLATEDTKGATNAVNTYLKNNPLPDGVATSSGGLVELIKDSLPPMIQALLIAIFLVYTVMVLQFEFFKQPLIVMASIPFTLIGVIIGLLIFNSSISLLSFMAIIALSGMVVNNGILLIESINIKMRETAILEDENLEKQRILHAISTASAQRLRPILMTTLTTMLGVIPMALATGEASSIYAPLGQAIVGGLISSTLLTLFIIPLLYDINEMSNLKKEAKEVKDMRKKLFSVLLISLTIIITSCSVVFRGGLGGVVNDSDNNPISGMKVWVYLDKEARDTDYNTYSSDPESVQESSMIKGSAITDENGNFTINAIIWNSSSPIFGKTADLREVYLLFYHELFGLQKNRFAVRIYSDATNSGAINETFSRVKERSNFSLTIENVATYTQLNQTVTATIKVYKSDDTLIETIEKNITGSDTIEITKDIEEEVKVSVALSKELSSWTQCDEDGNALPAVLPTTTFSSTIPSITLYMKSSRLTLPSLNGIYRNEIYVDSDDIENGTYADDNVTLLLCEKQGDTFIPFDSPNARIVTDKRITGTNTPMIEHGLFEGLGEGIEFTDTTYTGRYATKTVYIVVVDNDEVPASGHDYFQITVNSNESNKHVGLLMAPTATIP